MKVLSLTLKTVVNPQTHVNEVVMASALMREGVSVDGSTPGFATPEGLRAFTVLRSPTNALPLGFKEELKKKHLEKKVIVQQNERALLNFLLTQIHRMDPDIILGHNILQHDLNVLLSRMQATSIREWSKLGRLKIGALKSSNNKGKEKFYGV